MKHKGVLATDEFDIRNGIFCSHSHRDDFASIVGRSGQFTGVGRKNWKRSDEKVREEVCDRLDEDGYLDASNIDVEVANGIVSLKGKVRDRFNKKLAENLSDTVRGVKDVRNNLEFHKFSGDASQLRSRMEGTKFQNSKKSKEKMMNNK